MPILQEYVPLHVHPIAMAKIQLLSVRVLVSLDLLLVLYVLLSVQMEPTVKIRSVNLLVKLVGMLLKI